MESEINSYSFLTESRKDNIQKSSRDMKFVSIFIIISGAAYTLSIVGAIFGIPLIFAGLRMRQSAEAWYNYLITNQQVDFDGAIEKQAQAFWILKIIIIASLIVYLMIFIAFWVLILPMLNH